MKSKIFLSLLLSGSIACFAQGYKDGIEYFKVSEYDNAKELLERNLNDAATNKAEAYYYLGGVALANGNTAAAKDYFQKGTGAGSCMLNYVGLGQLQLMAGDVKGAEANFKEAISGSPKKDAKILVAIARAYYTVDGVKYAKQVADYIKKARKNNKTEADTPILEGDMAAKEDKTGDAQGMYDEAISYNPTLSEPYVKYARALFKVSPQQSIQRLQDLLAQNPSSALAQRELAEKYYENDQWTKAAEQYGEYIKNPNHFKQDEVRYASLLFYGKKYQESLELARRIEASLPATDKNVFYMKRLELYNLVAMEKWEDADAAAQALFAMNVPEGAKFEVKDYTDYADALKKLKRPQEALQLRTKAYEANPDKLDLLKDLSDGYSDAEDYVNSAKYYQMFVDKGDYKTNDLFVLSKKYFYVAAFDSVPESKAVAVANALKYVDMVNEKIADNVRMRIMVNLHKAKILQVSENEKTDGKAVDTYKAVLELLDQDPANLTDRKDDYILAYNYLANYYFATGDKETMKYYYVKWLEADPNNEPLRKYIEGLSK